MDAQCRHKFEVVVVSGPPRGDLYELEQETIYQIVDRYSGEIIMEFASLMEASLSRDTGMWDDFQYTGVSDVVIAADGKSVVVKFHDGHEEIIPLL